jgi:hypothetical protein
MLRVLARWSCVSSRSAARRAFAARASAAAGARGIDALATFLRPHSHSDHGTGVALQARARPVMRAILLPRAGQHILVLPLSSK